MDFSQIPLFALADRRMAWVDQRQQVLAQDIANADTPGWRARDLTPFAQQLRGLQTRMTQTSALHLTPPSDQAAGVIVESGERAPDGNSVAIDRVLEQVANTDSAHELVTTLTHSYVDMFRTAIGKS
jgi:flagellar basal-body rod protein FlgB